MMLTEFHFLRPLWLLALIPLAGLSWHFIHRGREGGDWRRVCDPALLPYILIHDTGGKPARRASWLMSVGGLLAIIAVAGPVWERLPVPAFRNDAALVIALDLSHIMEAADLKPSRLERARFKMADILRQRKDGLTALLVYSGDAFTVTPLTDDNGTILSQLPALTSDLMPAQGSRADLALELAGRLLKQAGLTRGDVLLMTDGGSLSKAFDAAKNLRSQGYRVSVLGVGSEEGAPVPLREGGFLQDSKGNIVIAKLASSALRQLAEDGGGIYRKLSTDNSDWESLLAFFDQQTQAGENEPAKAQGIAVEQWEEFGVWLLLPLLPLAALAFRRGYLVGLILLLLPLPKPAQALAWQDWWQTKDQQASQALQAGDPAKAAENFTDPAWKAAAQYKANQFEQAAQTLQGQLGADAQYNLGNALAKLGQYPQAIGAYDHALKLDPKHEDARYNKELVEQALKDQKQKQKQQQKQSGKGQNPDNKQSKKHQKGNSQQSQDQQPDQAQNDPSKDQQQPPKNPTGQQQQNLSQPNQGEEQQQGKTGESKPDQQGQQAQPGQEEQNGQPKEEKQGMAQSDLHQKENDQAIEQWLRRIPDDPGGLLRRKFAYQYQQRRGQN